MRKFELIYDADEMKVVDDGKKLYRIIAVSDFGKVTAGSLGGFVESENNLSQEGNCWIADEAMVYGGARIEGDALLIEEAVVSGDVVITDNVVIEGDGKVQNKTGQCITIGDHMHIACGALIEAPDNFATITLHEGTVSFFKNDQNGIDICFYQDDKFVHESVTEFLSKNAKKGLSFTAILVLGALSTVEDCMKAKAASSR